MVDAQHFDNYMVDAQHFEAGTTLPCKSLNKLA
jgi:hypothetical protein